MGHSVSIDRASIAFGPEALSSFTQILEEVTVDLIDDGLSAELMRSDGMRTKLALRLLSFAHSGCTPTQIKKRLLRVSRNEISASRRLRDRGAETKAELDDRVRRHRPR